MVKRSAFTLIELIFAIVVIGISVISLPMMSQTTTKGLDANLVQEAIFGASAELNGAITAHWDEHSLNDDKNALARVIDVNDTSCINSRKVGHIVQPFHRRCLDDSSIDPLNGTSDDEIFALEDMQHDATDVFDSASSATGYKKSYQSKVEVTHSADFNGSNDEIKEIMLTITDADAKTITLLRSYSMNLGEVDYYKKRMD